MKGNGRNAGAVAAIVKGDKPYDQATIDAALTQFADTAKKLPTLFPDSAKGMKPEGDFSASPKVWDDKAGFAAKIASFAAAVTEAKAKIKDADTLKANFPRHRQGMRRLSRDLPPQEQLISVSIKKRADANGVRPFLLSVCRVERPFPLPLWERVDAMRKHRGRVRGLSPRIETPHPPSLRHSRCKASACLRTAAGGRLWAPSPTRGEGKGKPGFDDNLTSSPRCEVLTSSPGRGFRRPDWPRCEC